MKRVKVVKWRGQNEHLKQSDEKKQIYVLCREEENLVFWFSAQFISTLNFTQSG